MLPAGRRFHERRVDVGDAVGGQEGSDQADQDHGHQQDEADLGAGALEEPAPELHEGILPRGLGFFL